MSDDEFRFLSARHMKARLTVFEVSYLLNCSPEDVQALVRDGLLKPLGNPPVNGRKFFDAKRLAESMQDSNWLARVTNAIYRRWRVKNASRQDRSDPKTPNHYARAS